MPTTTGLDSTFAQAIAALEAVPVTLEAYRDIDDGALLELAKLSARALQLSNTHASLIAGELARRSAPELGSAGLAQRTGHRTPQELFRATTKVSARDASTAVRVGLVLQQQSPVADPVTGEVAADTEPWLRGVAAAVMSGSLSPAAADAIRSGIGTPSASVSAATLAGAVDELCATGATLDADRLFRLARTMRDALDEEGIADRERERRAKRSLTVTTLPNGMVRAVWIESGESAAVITDLYDRATSPRRGGPRFVDEGRAQQSASIISDERTTEQLASDVFVELLRQGSNADSTQLLGTGAPIVTALVNKVSLDSRRGHGFLGNQPDAVSIETIERLACSGATWGIIADESGQPFDEEREQRFYNRRQRRALAARDGGCRFPGCDRPASWTEAHHIEHWARDGGKTNIADGILLCRHHHLLLHNNHWEIKRHGEDYVLIPPPDYEFGRDPILMPSKSLAWTELRAV